MMKNQYQELRERQQAEINDFPLIFAFNDKQFETGLHKLGLTIKDTCQMCSIGAGCYCRKSDAPKLHEMFRRHRKELWDAIKGDATGQSFIHDMFVSELNNHEYSYTGEVDETLDALGITPQHLTDLPQLRHGLELACTEIMRHDCFD